MAKSIEETLPLALRYDPATGKLFWRDDWYPASRPRKEAGYNDRGYIYLHHRGRNFFAHRVVWFLYYGEWPPKEIDHIDGNGLNNRIENLRLSDRTQNMCNRGAYKCNKLGLKGVRPEGRKYAANISYKKKSYWLGAYDRPEDAAKAYDRKAIELHGTYAKTNFPIEDYQGV